VSLKEAVALIMSKVARYLEEKLTGKITFVFHCRDGGIGRVSLNVEQDLSKKDLTDQ
jgi:hypothetical protein